jgi:hypothetical protein
VLLGVLFCGNAAFNFPSHGWPLGRQKKGTPIGTFAFASRGRGVLRGKIGEQYRRYAQASVELARNAEGQRTQALLLHMARVWFRLAEEHEKETDEKQSAES